MPGCKPPRRGETGNGFMARHAVLSKAGGGPAFLDQGAALLGH